MTLTDFLLARIAEDEAAANARIDAEVEFLCNDGLPDTTREDLLTMESDAWRKPLAECEAKRRIVERLKRVEVDVNGGERRGFYADAVHDCARDLAAIYAAHPDYREEWRP